MAIKDWNGFKKSGDTYIPNDATARAGVTATVDLMKDTTGWLGGNECPYPYQDKGNKLNNGINFVDNDNGTITVKAGTATGGNAQYYIVGNGLSVFRNVSDLVGKTIVGNPTNYSESNVDLRLWFYDANKTYLVGDHVTNSGTVLNIPTNAVYYVLVIRVDNGLTVPADVLISPMIITPEQYALNPTYRPYHGSVEEVKADKSEVQTTISLLDDTVGWVGKNRFNGKATTKTAQGVTWTVNESDNNVVTVSGTPTGFEPLTIDSNNVLPVGEYVLSGISDMVNVVYNGVFLYKGNTRVRDLQIQDNNIPHTFSILQSDDYDTIRVQLKRATNGVACSGTGKIMITTPEEYKLSPSYEPYHESVAEMLATKDVTVTAGTDVTVNANTHVYSKAGVVTGSLRLEIGATLTAGATIATLSAIPKNTTYAIGIDNTDKSVIPIIIGNNGAVQLFGGFIPTSGNQLLIPIAYATA